MKETKKPPGLKIFLGILLALVCILVVELAVAKIADPDLYHAVVDPVVKVVEDTTLYLSHQVVAAQTRLSAYIAQTGETIKDNWENTKESVVTFLDSLWPEPEPEPTLQELAAQQALEESQLAIPREQAHESITHFESDMATNQEMLVGSGHSLYYFNQTDDRWSNYGSDSMAGYGCGPTAMAMVVSTLTGRFYNPQTMADIFVEEKFWAPGGGTYHNFAYGSGERFDMNVTPLLDDHLTADKLTQHLMGGGLVIALMQKGHFTNGGHFIVLHGATLTGDILVADPASRDRSLVTWDPQLILDELSTVSSNGGPLWLFTKSTGISGSQPLIPE